MRDKLIPEEKIMAIQEQFSGFIVEQVLIQKANSTTMEYLILTIATNMIIYVCVYIIKNEYTYVNIYVCVCIIFLFMSMYVLYI